MYEHVLSPINIGGIEIPNRIFRSAHGTAIGGGTMSDDLIAYHEARARGGVGLTILEILSVHPSSPGTLNLFDPTLGEGYLKLMDKVRPHGMKIFQQIWHAGHNGTPIDGSPPWSSSDVASPEVGVVPRAMTKMQIDEIVGAYANAARLCKESGLDGVEVHGAHGYLIQQFMSENFNKREDEYGGSLENRLRFLLEVMRAIRSEVGSGEFATGIRLAPDLTAGGVGVDVNAAAIEALKAEGLANFINISLGNYHSFPKMIGGMHEPVGYELETSTPIGKHADVPVMVIGRFRTLEEVDQVIRQGDADMVGMTRATIADPDIVIKTRRGEEARIRPCIACNQGCVGQLLGDEKRMGCAVNPAVGYELVMGDDKLDPVDTAKRVLVIGGGPAGMEAARVAAKRGHDVVLAEAMADLGGTLSLAGKAPRRQQMNDIIEWLQNEVYLEGVDVRLSTFVTEEDIEDFGAEHIIVATGAEPRVDGMQLSHPGESIEGIELGHVVSSNDLFQDATITGTNALVIDDVGHYEALAVAEQLLENGSQVTMVTRLPALAQRVRPALMVDPALERFSDKPFQYRVGTRVLKIDGQSASLQAVVGGDIEQINADLVVFVSLNKPRDAICSSLSDKGLAYTLIGDANTPRFLVTAIAEGNRVGRTI